MTVSCPAFAGLAAALCKAAGATLPPIIPDTEGSFGFRLEVDGVAVTVMHQPERFPDHAFVLVAFGLVPAAAEADVYRELLDANLLMMRPGAPVFGRDPLDGQIVLQACCALAGTSGDALMEGIRVAVSKAIAWRQVHRLVPSDHDSGHVFGAAFA